MFVHQRVHHGFASIPKDNWVYFIGPEFDDPGQFTGTPEI